MGLDFLSGLSGISTLMGLENLAKKPTESATPTSDSPTSSSSTPSGGLTTITGPGGKKIVVDQSSSDQIYKNLQDQYNLRNSEFADWQNRMMAARAAAIPNLHGESSNAQLALRQQQETERKDRLAMLMDMAAMKGSQAQQNLLRNSLSGGPNISQGVGTIGDQTQNVVSGGAASVIPPYAQKQINDMVNAGDIDAALKLKNEIIQKAAEKRQDFENNAESLKQQTYWIVDPITHEGHEETLTPKEYRALTENPKNPLYNPVAPPVPVSAPTNKPELKNDDVLQTVKKGIFGQESSSGLNPKPSVNGALGPMQITPATWETYVNRGIIPKEWDINSPNQNKQAGEKIVDYLYNQYNGDVDKTLAAYHGGEGAVDKTGAIKLNTPDGLGVTNAQYISDVRNKAGLNKTEIVTDDVLKNLPKDVQDKLDNVKTEDEHNAILNNYKASLVPTTQFTGQNVKVASADNKPMTYSEYKNQLEVEKQKKLANIQVKKTSDIKNVENAATDLKKINDIALKADDTAEAANSIINLASNPKKQRLFAPQNQDTKAASILNATSGVRGVGKIAENLITKNPQTGIYSPQDIAERNIIQSNATKLGIDYANQAFSGTRMTNGFTKLAQEAKGVGADIPWQTNYINAVAIREKAQFNKAAAKDYYNYQKENLDKNNFVTFTDYVNTDRFKKLEDATHERLVKQFPSYFKPSDERPDSGVHLLNTPAGENNVSNKYESSWDKYKVKR